MNEYNKDQLWKIYETLPKDLKDSIFSPETADNIYDVATKNGAEDKVSEIAKQTGYVLLGLLPPNEFQEALEIEVGIKKETAQKISRDINRFVFWPVKETLAEIYKLSLSAPSETSTNNATAKMGAAKNGVKKEKPKKQDAYRELIE